MRSRREGLEVLIDRRDLPYGEEWKPELLDFVRRSDAVVFVISPARRLTHVGASGSSSKSGPSSKRLIPIELAAVPASALPPQVGAIQLLPFSGLWVEFGSTNRQACRTV